MIVLIGIAGTGILVIRFSSGGLHNTVNGEYNSTIGVPDQYRLSFFIRKIMLSSAYSLNRVMQLKDGFDIASANKK